MSISKFLLAIATTLTLGATTGVFGSQLFLATGGIGGSDGAVSEYTTSGTPVHVPLLSGFNQASQIVISGSDMYVVSVAGGLPGQGKIGKYTTSGAVINASLITGLTLPTGIAVSGSNIYVATGGDGTPGQGKIGQYTTSGAAVNASLITGLSAPQSVVISGTDLNAIKLTKNFRKSFYSIQL